MAEIKKYRSKGDEKGKMTNLNLEISRMKNKDPNKKKVKKNIKK